jgi:RNA polymerase sigma factor (TIGR02999 family)
MPPSNSGALSSAPEVTLSNDHSSRKVHPENTMSSSDADAPAPKGDDRWDRLPELLAASETDAQARDTVITLLYPELRRIAEAHMRRERPDHTLQATALVGEFFVSIARNSAITARTRLQFLKLASVAMRRLLVDYARSRGAEKRGGDMIRLNIEGIEDPGRATEHLHEIDELLEQLAREDPRMAEIVELKFFGGLTNPEIAEALGISDRTVKRDWQVARAWLYSRLMAGRG